MRWHTTYAISENVILYQSARKQLVNVRILRPTNCQILLTYSVRQQDGQAGC